MSLCPYIIRMKAPPKPVNNSAPMLCSPFEFIDADDPILLQSTALRGQLVATGESDSKSRWPGSSKLKLYNPAFELEVGWN
jgi:hypothetical protein